METTLVEGVILINPFLKEERKTRGINSGIEVGVPIRVPNQKALQRGVGKEVYDSYNLGLERACADIVITLKLGPDGQGEVLASKRSMESHLVESGGCKEALSTLIDL